MSLTRQDRISMHKHKRGIVEGSPEPSLEQLDDGVPEIRTVVDGLTGKLTTKTFIRRGNAVLQNSFSSSEEGQTNQSSLWYMSDEISLTSAVTTPAITIPDNSFLMDVRIYVTEAITAGSLDLDVGDGSDTNRYINDFNASTGATAVGTIIAVGRASSSPDAEVGVATGRFYSDSDSLDAKVNVVATAGKIRLMALILKSPIVPNILNK